jgi:hypothetical protein
MFQLFLSARASNYFKARSAGRDTEIDHARAASVFRSIEDALDGAKAEQAGLKSRIDDVLARAAVTMGNDSDEYLTRSGGQPVPEFAWHRDRKWGTAIERAGSNHRAFPVFEDSARYKVSRGRRLQ